MVKRKVECSPDLVSDSEEPSSECELPKATTNTGPQTRLADPTGENTTGETASCHVPIPPAPVTEEGGEVAEAFWALLAAAGYQVW